MKKDDSIYLRHIIDAFVQIARNLSEDLRNVYPQIPWRQMIGLRNRMIHAYFNINSQIIWEIIQGDLPNLKREIKCILDNISKE